MAVKCGLIFLDSGSDKLSQFIVCNGTEFSVTATAAALATAVLRRKKRQLCVVRPALGIQGHAPAHHTAADASVCSSGARRSAATLRHHWGLVGAALGIFVGNLFGRNARWVRCPSHAQIQTDFCRPLSRKNSVFIDPHPHVRHL